MEHVDFLNRILPLDTLPSTDSRFGNLHDDLIQHTVRNYDYSTLEVLSRHVKLFSVPDAVFGQFLSETLHPVVRDSEVERRELLSLYNTKLRLDGFEIVQAGQLSGRPLFALQRISPSPMTASREQPSASVIAGHTSAPLPRSSRADLEASFYVNVPDVIKPSQRLSPTTSPLPSMDATVDSNPSRKYDVVLSYASEQREYARKVAESRG